MVSLLSLTYSMLLLGARLTYKWEFLSYDDAVLGLGYVFAAAHYGTILKAISDGLGALTTVSSSSQVSTIAEVSSVSRPQVQSVPADAAHSTTSRPGSSAWSHCS